MNENYQPPKKVQSTAKLKKKLWREFSIYIRRREADDNGFVRCFTCRKISHWKELDAGHYIAKNVGGANLYFNEKNVQPQCTACNRFRHGNLHQYALRLQEKYGGQILVWLEAYRKGSAPYTASELTLLINHYKTLNANFGTDHSRSLNRAA